MVPRNTRSIALSLSKSACFRAQNLLKYCTAVSTAPAMPTAKSPERLPRNHTLYLEPGRSIGRRRVSHPAGGGRGTAGGRFPCRGRRRYFFAISIYFVDMKTLLTMNNALPF